MRGELRVATFCEEYDRQHKAFRSNHGADSARVAVTGMTVNRRAIECEVDGALQVVRHPELGVVMDSLRTLAYFDAWLVRRGGWE